MRAGPSPSAEFRTSAINPKSMSAAGTVAMGTPSSIPLGTMKLAKNADQIQERHEKDRRSKSSRRRSR